MRLKISPKWTIAILPAIFLLLYFGFGAYFYFLKPVTNAELKASLNQRAGITSFPVSIRIPDVGVSASLEQVGRTPEGDMGSPKSPANAAWFALGAVPGQTGSAVIAGHYGWENGIPAVFDNLRELRKGDVVYVIDDKGTTVTFVVREIKIYGENDDSAAVFNSNDGKARLNLITCEGMWNKNTKSYSDRIVVFTEREN